VKFWDTSALVPLVVDEPATDDMQRVLADDGDVLTWTFTGVELLSAIARLGRVASGLEDLAAALRLEAIARARQWHRVTDVEGVRRRAERLVGIHPLSAADAMQLGAALAASGDRPETLDFVTLDRPLARCAQLEGFRVIGAGAS
jgi:predicted nucleic acid-binding protein